MRRLRNRKASAHAQGQASGDLRQIAREEAMRNYARGKGAGDTLKDFDALRAQDVQGAISRRQAELGAIGGKQQTPRLGNQYEAGAASLENVRKAERALSDQIGTGYGEAGEIGLSFKGDAIPLLRKRVDSDLAAATVDMSKETTPFTFALGRSSMISRTHRLSRPRTGRAWQERRNRPCSRISICANWRRCASA